MLLDENAACTPPPKTFLTPLRIPTPLQELNHQQCETPDSASRFSSRFNGNDDAIKVIARVRPLREGSSRDERRCVVTPDSHSVSIKEPQQTTPKQVSPLPPKLLLAPGGPHSFNFDFVAEEEATQQEVYEAAGEPIVENCLAGYHGCILAYGQTGSGKTFTMTGNGGGGDSRGIVQRAFEHLFQRLDAMQAETVEGRFEYNIKCSFLEIYNERLFDLLLAPAAAAAANTDLVISNAGGTFVRGLTEVEVTSVPEAMKLLKRGMESRRVAATGMNERSSRSHAVFTCHLTVATTTPAGLREEKTSMMHMVDLAGSEQAGQTGAEGMRLTESGHINKSLVELGRVVREVIKAQKAKRQAGGDDRTARVLCRGSKLTHLLQDALGGNAKTVLVATVSPAAADLTQTIGTLTFARDVKGIKSHATLNRKVSVSGEALAVAKENDMLRQSVTLKEAELLRVMEELQAAALANAELAEQLSLVQGQADMAKEALVQEQEAAAEAHMAHMEALEQIDRMRKSICNMEEASESLQQSLLEVQAEVAQRDEEHAAEVRRLETENEQTQVYLASAMQKLQAATAAAAAAEERACNAAEDAAEVSAQHKQQLQALLQEMEALQKQIEEGAEVVRLQEENEQLQESLMLVEDRLRRAKAAAAEAEERSDAAKAAAAQQAVEHQDQLATLHGELAAARQQAEEATAAAAALQQQLDEQAAESQRLLVENMQLLQAGAGKCGGRWRPWQALAGSRGRSQSPPPASLQADLARTQELLRAATAAASDAECRAISAESCAAAAVAAGAEVDAQHQQQLGALQAELDASRQQAEEAGAAVAALQQQVQECEIQLVGKDFVLDELRSKLAVAETKLQEMHGKVKATAELVLAATQATSAFNAGMKRMAEITPRVGR